MKKLTEIFVLLMSFLVFTSQTEAESNSQFIIINKQTNILAFYQDGKLVRTFKVATGRTRSLTPEGKFRIVNKIVNRPYYKHNIPGGDPRNPLGNRWMGLEARGTYGTTYGIHGNNNESSIGKYVSSGCVRMHNGEVRWLFSRVNNYTPVVITYSSSSFDTIALANGYPVTVPASGDGSDSIPIEPQNGWIQANGNKYYYENGTAKTGWQTIAGKRYFFYQSGAMQTGWLTLGSQKYFLDINGVMRTGWFTIGGERYYFDQSGVMQTGWLEAGGEKYYLDSSGAAKTGWIVVDDGKYYLDEAGAVKTGWIEDSGQKYYFDSSGMLQTGWFENLGKKYFSDQSGVVQTGWLEAGGQNYYLDQDGAVTTGWLEIGDKKYYFDQTGAMKTGWTNDSGSWYYLAENGVLQTGWVNDNGSWYYLSDTGSFDTALAAVLNEKDFNETTQGTNWLELSGERYYLSSRSSTVANWINYKDHWYYLDVSKDMEVISGKK
ncbi:L,D-transpeptidase family protein [Neobacillus kokaensis]|uniref:L,D-TPase catalytic domain-containing protein n=1 Tax=Neobacillus kokaensis TaxID=2759023 RepID=A0ABQ3N2F7_9BACI|nr:L,D-transpeptidase family protein [Neobacillus kokaensis]GHH98040.1 hypothetical protein AM1BK_15830 [Neobacillus kokaensis]